MWYILFRINLLWLMADILDDQHKDQVIMLVEQNFDACCIAREM